MESHSASRKITALKAQKRRRDRVNVYLDGEYAFALSRIVAAWLEVGAELSEAKIAELTAADQREAAYQQALKFLSYRPRSEAEIRNNLCKHDIDETIILDVLQRLKKSGLLHDRDFARNWVANRNEFSPRGRRALRAELRQKRVADDLIDEALAELDETTLAERAARQKAHKVHTDDWQTFFRKMAGFLGRRGFNYEIIREIVPRLWAERSAAKSEEEV